MINLARTIKELGWISESPVMRGKFSSGHNTYKFVKAAVISDFKRTTLI